MPTYNRAKWISLAIECYLQQTFTDSELVILDNGDDETESVVPAHPRIRYYKQPGQKLNTGEIRNRVNELAQGEIVCHWDDDDWSAPNRIETQVARLLSSGKQVTGYHSISYWDTSSNRAPEDRAHIYQGTASYACGTSQLYFKNWWTQHPFNTKAVGEDSDFSHAAKCSKQLDSVDGRQMIVARAHSDSTCPAPLGSSSFPRVRLPDMPQAFLEAVGVK
jgi:glycosyltransferase involved in cell wall biosynthesis